MSNEAEDHARSTDDPYWNETVALGEAVIARGETHRLYLQIHTEEESYTASEEDELGFRLTARRGERSYVHAKPFILVPRLRLTMAVKPSPPCDAPGCQSIGEIIESEVEGMERRAIGNLQAWHYPVDKLLVFWECDIFPSWREKSDSAVDDLILFLVWGGFESLLLEKFPDATRIITPAWEPNYETNDWQRFLGANGYEQGENSPRAFIKSIIKR